MAAPVAPQPPPYSHRTRPFQDGVSLQRDTSTAPYNPTSFRSTSRIHLLASCSNFVRFLGLKSQGTADASVDASARPDKKTGAGKL